MKTTAMKHRSRRDRRRGQAAVETMMLAFMVAVMVVATFHLWKVTWAAENSNIRAREAMFHGTAYMTGPRAGNTSASALFNQGEKNYNKATPGGSINFSSSASDSVDGAGNINVNLRITQ